MNKLIILCFSISVSLSAVPEAYASNACPSASDIETMVKSALTHANPEDLSKDKGTLELGKHFEESGLSLTQLDDTSNHCHYKAKVDGQVLFTWKFPESAA